MKGRHVFPSVAGVWLLIGIAALCAQSQGAPGVTFQTEVTYVDVDASVTDEQGKFVGNLTKEDFQVFEDGKPQKIDTFSLVEIPLERHDRFLFMEKPVRSDVKSNRRPFSGRLYVIVLDDLDVSPFRTGLVRKFAREFVEKYFGANDLAAVVYTSGRTDASQEFTSDPQLLLAAIDKFLGRRLRSQTLDSLDARYTQMVTQGTQNEEDASQATSLGDKLSSTRSPGEMERGYRATGVLDTLKNLSEFLSAVRGRRKALLLFSEGIDYPLNDVFGTNSGSDVMRATQDAITAAARANVNFFTLDPRGLIGMSTEFIELQGPVAESLGSTAGTPTNSVTPFNGQKDLLSEMRVSQDSLRSLAEETGGMAAINANSLTPAFQRIVDGNSRYYVLGYYPPTHPRDGRFHKIEVRVSRPGLKVSARKGYASARGKTPEERKRDEEARRARDARKPLADNTSAELRDVLGSPLPQSGLTFAGTGRGVSKHQERCIGRARHRHGRRSPPLQQATGWSVCEPGRAVAVQCERGRQGSARRARHAEPDDSARHVSARPDRRCASEPTHHPSAGTLSAAGGCARKSQRQNGHRVLRSAGTGFQQAAIDARRPASGGTLGAAVVRGCPGPGGRQAAAWHGDEPARIQAERHVIAADRDLRQRHIASGAQHRDHRAADRRIGRGSVYRTRLVDEWWP